MIPTVSTSIFVAASLILLIPFLVSGLTKLHAPGRTPLGFHKLSQLGAVILPPNSTGTTIATLTSGGKDFQQAILVDATTPTQGLAIDATGGAMVRGEAASGAAVTGNPVLVGGQDGTNVVTLKTASAANLAVGATAANGALMATRPADWSLNNLPAAATQATVTKAAGAAGVKHFCTSVAGAISTVGTAQAAALVFNLRDGATGAGTVLWALQVSLPVNTTWSFFLSGLNIAGSAATAMTMETVAAPAAAAFASVAFTGYDAS